MDCLNKPIRCEFCGANTWILEGINQCDCPENNPEGQEDQETPVNETILTIPRKNYTKDLTKNQITPKL